MMSNTERDKLAEYFADDAATDFLAQAESNPDSAKEALLLAAGYIRRGEALPGNLADYLAGAIEAAMVKPKGNRAKALTDELNLTTNYRRPAGDWACIGCEAEQLINEGSTKNKAFEDMANKYGIDEKTVKKYFQKCGKYQSLIDADLLQRGIKPPQNCFKEKRKKPPTF